MASRTQGAAAEGPPQIARGSRGYWGTKHRLKQQRVAVMRAARNAFIHRRLRRRDYRSCGSRASPPTAACAHALQPVIKRSQRAACANAKENQRNAISDPKLEIW